MTKPQRLKYGRGVTLIEIMAAVVVLSVAVIGTSGYRYYATLDARKADVQMTAARIALLLAESWHGEQGKQTYDPVAHLGSGFITSDTGPTEPADFTLLGSYKVVSNRTDYYVTLSWKNVTTGLRALNVEVAWAQRQDEDPTFNEADKSFKLTTYALI